MNQTLLACGFASPDEVRTLLERCGVTVRRPLSDAETQYHQKARHMRRKRFTDALCEIVNEKWPTPPPEKGAA